MKACAKPVRRADFVQKLGNTNARHQPVEGSVQTLGFRRRDRLRRRYVKNAIAKGDALQAIMAQGVGETPQSPVEETAALPQIVFTFRRHRQRLGVLGHIGFRQEIAVELLIILGSFDPDVAGSQPATQNGERRDFIKAAINGAVFHNEAAARLSAETTAAAFRTSACAVLYSAVSTVRAHESRASCSRRLET